MSETYRQTRVEELDREHPGLETFVRELMKLGTPYFKIHEQVMERFGVEIGVSTLQSYWRRRFNPDLEAERHEYRKAKAQVDVLVSECGADPDKDATQILALLVRSAIFKQQEKLEEADVMKLLAEERKRQEVEIQRGQLQVALTNAETAKKEAEAKAARLEKERDAVKEAIGGAESNEGKDAEALQLIREIYGITA
jgi:Protein of unknown function (DUF3486)